MDDVMKRGYEKKMGRTQMEKFIWQCSQKQICAIFLRLSSTGQIATLMSVEMKWMYLMIQFVNMNDAWKIKRTAL